MSATVESSKEFGRRATLRQTKIAQKHKAFLKCGGFAFPGSSLFCFSILLACIPLLNLSYPLPASTGCPEPTQTHSLPLFSGSETGTRRHAPPHPIPGLARACAEPLIARTRSHHPQPYRQPRECEVGCSQPQVFSWGGGYRLYIRTPPTLHDPSLTPWGRALKGMHLAPNGNL